MIRRETDHVILEVRDNGCGITPELLSRFEQTGAGMGVGLSGMRERVRELRGGMNLEGGSRGTSLRVNLPLAPESA